MHQDVRKVSMQAAIEEGVLKESIAALHPDVSLIRSGSFYRAQLVTKPMRPQQ